MYSPFKHIQKRLIRVGKIIFVHLLTTFGPYSLCFLLCELNKIKGSPSAIHSIFISDYVIYCIHLYVYISTYRYSYKQIDTSSISILTHISCMKKSYVEYNWLFLYLLVTPISRGSNEWVVTKLTYTINRYTYDICINNHADINRIILLSIVNKS